ncbi:GNAT family N-acetyltransferase [Microvirga rosea]|uniref:GNAT family N-acetyltransferase n=1 Tax=Microvirga rosea TaxID=2715425 RepID=UPI001D0A15F9|nr:GNAT family N-acetyltransferase [Microvirga rosea]MCB8823538.1 GNAT family N-acetyltransferase [Microvirga rosea]
MSDSLTIRPWNAADIPAVARILALGWHQAYASFMPEAVLAPRSDPEYRTRELSRWLDQDFDDTREALLVAETEDCVSGFVAVRLGDKADLGTVAFIPLLYVAPQAQRRRLGARLLLAGLDWIGARASGALAIPAFAQNPYRGFYDAIGGITAKTVMVDLDGHSFDVVQYYWPSLEAARFGIPSRL